MSALVHGTSAGSAGFGAESSGGFPSGAGFGAESSAGFGAETARTGVLPA
jgi:hypothetical protein